MKELEPYVPISVLAKHFSVSRWTIHETWIKPGVIPFIRLGRDYRFRISDVEAALRKISTNPQEPPLPSGTQLELNFDDPTQDF